MFLDHAWRRVLGIDRRYVVIMVVAVKQCLHAVASQKETILSHLLLIVVLPVAVSILGIEVVFVRRQERRRDAPMIEVIPVEALEPNVILDLLRAVEAKPINRLALYQLVNEVGGLKRPSRRDLVLADLHLLR